MRESRSYGSVGERGGNESRYPEIDNGELRIENNGELIMESRRASP
jgi:hypothetical protein